MVYLHLTLSILVFLLIVAYLTIFNTCIFVLIERPNSVIVEIDILECLSSAGLKVNLVTFIEILLMFSFNGYTS